MPDQVNDYTFNARLKKYSPQQFTYYSQSTNGKIYVIDKQLIKINEM